MTITTLQLTLILKAPYLTQSAMPGNYGVDVSLAKNHRGQFYIPATLLIGKLREAWKELSDLNSNQFPVQIEQWLGDKSDPTKTKDELPENTVEPRRKRLLIEDLVFVESNIPQKEQKSFSNSYRIRIDPQSGSVMPRAYLVTEKPFALGEQITFQGHAYFLTADDTERNQLIFCLKKGLQWIDQLGANRTIGFGELLQVIVEETSPTIHSQETLPKNTRYGLQLRPNAPFCLAERRIMGNLFRSDETIPGGAVKGLLAAMFPNDLPKYFNDLWISHAFPSGEKRPWRFPLSLVQVGQHCYDVALCETPGLFWEGEGQARRLSAPAFAIDWKSDAKIKEMFGWPAVKRELRMHTAIDGNKRRSQDEQLFAYETVFLPTEQEKSGCWLAYIDLSPIPEEHHSQVVQKLQELTAHHLLGLGKTKTVVDATIIPADRVQPHCACSLTARDGLWIITLQTPALLCEPSIELFQAYTQVWQQLSEGSLKMVRFFATQTLSGGRYFYKRFQDHRDDPNQPQPYRPYLLTDAGSVFVLAAVNGQEAQAQSCIEAWFYLGLPLAQSLLDYYQLSCQVDFQWQQCPYVPQNGYGEIAVNLPVHWDCCPKKDSFYSLPSRV